MESIDGLRLRGIREDDLLFFYDMYSNPEVMRYTLTDACTRLEDYLPYFENSMRDAMKAEKLRFEYVAELPDGTRIGMGDIDLDRAEPSYAAEIGYMLLPQYWGQGYATRIAGRLLKIGFSELGLKRMFARCNAHNTRSENVMKKCGMRLEGVGIGARFKNGAWQDELRYAITSGEWQAGQTQV